MFWKGKKSNLKNLNNLDYSTLESSDAIPSSIQFRQYLYVSSRVKLRAIYLQRSMFRLSRKSNLNPQVGVTYVPTYKKILLIVLLVVDGVTDAITAKPYILQKI